MGPLAADFHRPCRALAARDDQETDCQLGRATVAGVFAGCVRGPTWASIAVQDCRTVVAGARLLDQRCSTGRAASFCQTWLFGLAAKRSNTLAIFCRFNLGHLFCPMSQLSSPSFRRARTSIFASKKAVLRGSRRQEQCRQPRQQSSRPFAAMSCAQPYRTCTFTIRRPTSSISPRSSCFCTLDTESCAFAKLATPMEPARRLLWR